LTIAPIANSPGAWSFLLTALTIFGINFVLSADNGVLIAVVVSKLPGSEKFRVLGIAAGLAVIFQVGATFFAARLLHLRYFQLAGGLLVLWVAINLFTDDGANEANRSSRHGFWKAIWLIVAAELTMSTDNIFTVAAIAKGDLPLLLLGLAPSIVLVVCASGWLSFLIGRFPLIIFAAAGILGNVAANMIMTDAFAADIFKPSVLLRHCVQAITAVAVVATGYFIQRMRAGLAIAPGSRGGMA
jgi:YjbE family integral membrane protein